MPPAPVVQHMRCKRHCLDASLLQTDTPHEDPHTFNFNEFNDRFLVWRYSASGYDHTLCMHSFLFLCKHNTFPRHRRPGGVLTLEGTVAGEQA